MVKKINEYTEKVLKSKKLTNIIVFLCVAGIALIFLSNCYGKVNNKKTDGLQENTADLYKQQIENELTAVIENIEGTGNVKVLVTLETGVEYVYENEESNGTSLTEDYSGDSQTKMQKSNSNNKNIILTDDGCGGKKPLLKTEIQPTVKGVVVVCDGGDNEEVAEKIENLVTVALNISSKNVCVSK